MEKFGVNARYVVLGLFLLYLKLIIHILSLIGRMLPVLILVLLVGYVLYVEMRCTKTFSPWVTLFLKFPVSLLLAPPMVLLIIAVSAVLSS